MMAPSLFPVGNSVFWVLKPTACALRSVSKWVMWALVPAGQDALQKRTWWERNPSLGWAEDLGMAHAKQTHEKVTENTNFGSLAGEECLPRRWILVFLGSETTARLVSRGGLSSWGAAF